MKKLYINARIKSDIDLEKMSGFHWVTYNNKDGVHWENGIVTIYSNTREIVYSKLTQEVLDYILKLVIENKAEIIL